MSKKIKHNDIVCDIWRLTTLRSQDMAIEGVIPHNVHMFIEYGEAFEKDGYRYEWDEEAEVCRRTKIND